MQTQGRVALNVCLCCGLAIFIFVVRIEKVQLLIAVAVEVDEIGVGEPEFLTSGGADPRLFGDAVEDAVVSRGLLAGQGGRVLPAGQGSRVLFLDDCRDGGLRRFCPFAVVERTGRRERGRADRTGENDRGRFADAGGDPGRRAGGCVPRRSDGSRSPTQETGRFWRQPPPA